MISTDLTAAERKAYESNIWKSYVFTFLHSFQLWWPIWVIYLTDERGYSLTQVSVLEALFWVVIVLAEVPTGVVADRFGRKVSLVASSAFTGVAILVFGVAGNYPIVLLSYIVWGVGLTFQSGADSALVYESLKAVGREQDYQQVAGRGWGLFSLGVTLGLLAGAPIAAATNLSTPILLSAGITFAGLFVAASMKEPAVPHEERRLPYGDLLRGSIRTAWRTPKVRTMLVLGAILLAAPNVSVVFSQPFLDEHGVALSTFGLWQAPTRLASMGASLIAYRVSGTFGFRKTVLGAFVVLSGAYFVLGSWDSVYAFAGIGAALVILSMLLPIISDYVNQRIPNAQRATILSFRQLGTSVTIASIQPIQGLIADAWSLQAVFLATAAFLVVAVPLALIAWLRADSRPEEHEAGSKVAEPPSG